ncbi:hypothetical protein V495_02243 [Pseudogymnoascus sp. VKM F-4514 (FW-929)]|nr:hypothetical protein V495_02243 [Pseudogymnoascus sp. VKM F-4514 (FW-929)]KFY60735.1 hypothetical protein V497_03412 [Pseudogymnoascus sp. VKM F-4516 (FW-969)]
MEGDTNQQPYSALKTSQIPTNQTSTLSTLRLSENTLPTTMDQTSSQVKSESAIPSISPITDPEPLDIDTPPERYLPHGKQYSQSTPRDVAHAHNSATPTTNSDRSGTSVVQTPSKQQSGTQGPPRQQPATPKNKSPSLISRFFYGTTRLDSSNAEQLLNTQANEIRQLKVLLHEKGKDQERQQQHFQDAWQNREEELQQYNQNLRQQVQDLTSHRDKIQDTYNTLIRRQQEESFKRMETGRWLPMEESRVLEDFVRIRTQMRTWAKGAAVKNIGTIQEIGEEQHASLMASLSRVAVVENNQLPGGLSTPKGPSLLLNALLAHDVYTSLFRSPFYFLNDNIECWPRRGGLDGSLNKIYRLALDSNVEDAHIWRSQTLRLLLPPLQVGITDGEKGLHQWTKGMITKVARLHASRFAASSARHLIDTNTANIQRLNSIYQEAASIAYMLWTRKTAMRLSTLNDLGSPTFDVDDSRLKPHTMVHPDDHDDKLKGRNITLIVHPLLQVYGTDEGKDYDNVRVWVPAEAWFDTR